MTINGMNIFIGAYAERTSAGQLPVNRSDWGILNKQEQGFTKTAELSELFDADSPAVKLAISEDGMAYYRNSLPDKEGKDKNVLGDKEGLLSEKNMARSYNFELGNRFTLIGGNQTIEEKASDLFHAYAELYDEIVRGYESGQREIYDPNDPNGEGGYRKLTMSEEIDALNAAYKSYADALERFAGQREERVKFLEDVAETWSRFLGAQDSRAMEAWEAAREVAWRLKNEVVPEKLSEQLVKASVVFTQQYVSHKNVTVENLLKGITN